MSTLYENIVLLCKDSGIKPGKLCAEAGISRGLISDLKVGRKKTIQIETAKKIADYFGVSVDRVMGGASEDIKKELTLQEKDEFREIFADLTEENKAKALEYAALLLNSQHRS